MRKIAFILLISLLMPSEAIATNPKIDEMEHLAELVRATNLEIDKWQVVLKEKISQGKSSYLIKKWTKESSMTTTKSENTTTYFMKNTHNNTKISESFKVIVPHNKMYDAELIAIIDGVSWDEMIMKKYRKIVTTISNNYFTKKADKFTCLITDNDAIIKDVNFFEELKQKLDLKHVSTQTDTVKNSTLKRIIYGYTPLWDEKITIDNKPLNIQIVVQNTKVDNPKMIVGTPLLINEY